MWNRAEMIVAERQLLKFFCHEPSRLPASDSVWQNASVHAWREPEHQAIYSALLDLRLVPPAALRAELPSRLTRLGFPDVAWEDLFQASDLTPEQALRILSDLVEG